MKTKSASDGSTRWSRRRRRRATEFAEEERQEVGPCLVVMEPMESIRCSTRMQYFACSLFQASFRFYRDQLLLMAMVKCWKDESAPVEALVIRDSEEVTIVFIPTPLPLPASHIPPAAQVDGRSDCQKARVCAAPLPCLHQPCP